MGQILIICMLLCKYKFTPEQILIPKDGKQYTGKKQNWEKLFYNSRYVSQYHFKYKSWHFIFSDYLKQL